MTSPCGRCGEPKEATRANSKMCRACDGAERAKRETGLRQTKMRRLTLDLPIEVWDRLDADARENGQRIAGYTQHMLVKRDERLQAKRATP